MSWEYLRMPALEAPASRLLGLDCGHMAHLERPTAFADAVIDFAGR